MTNDHVAREWVAQGGEMFKQSFELDGRSYHQIAQSPSEDLQRGEHYELRGSGIGKLHLDSYGGRETRTIYARLYHVATGQCRWYHVKKLAATPPISAVPPSPSKDSQGHE